MKCPKCLTRELVVIEMAIGGEDVKMLSCSACEWRVWSTPDGAIPLTSVLAIAS